MRHQACFLIAELCGLALAVTPLRAQREPRMIPTVIAEAVALPARMIMGDSPHYTVGRAPAAFPATLLAAKPARIVGGSTLGFFVSTVFQYPRSIDAVATYEAFLRGAGYGAPHSAGLDALRHGFVSGSEPNPPHLFCKDSGTVAVALVDSTPTTRSMVVLSIREPGVHNLCNPDEPGGFAQPLDIPLLRPPPGVEATVGGSNSGLDHMETTIRLDTTLTASAILTHYARQLTAAKWTVAAKPAVGDGIAMRVLKVTSAKGETWHGALIVITGVTQREVVLRMVHDRT